MSRRKMKKNQGNTYIMVVATLSFLAVLTAAILVAIALIYKLKVYDINSRDNFYYLEQAMDEIYAGVGADSMKHLNEAYDDTIEVLVYYDMKSNSYITMENSAANVLLKRTFLNLIKEDPRYNVANVEATLKSFLSNQYKAANDSDPGNPEGIQLAVGGNVISGDTSVTVQNVTLKREAKYSTMNTRKSAGDKETFVQTITTDIVISEPEFNVNFGTIGSDLSDLYEFAFIADLGMEITGTTNKVNIAGNIYAAADFYNKDYNESGFGTPTSADDKTPRNKKPLTSYTATQMTGCNGVNLNSMYSGLYIDGADVVVAADKLVVPGTIAAMNGATINVSGLSQSTLTPAQLWADNITLAGYSFKAKDSNKLVGAQVNMRADAYISDDLELNAAGSSFYMNGGYYGYNYATTDNRTFTKDAVMAAKSRTFVSNVPQTIQDKEIVRYNMKDISNNRAGVKSQAHYNSSAIIVNGQDSSLDLSDVSAMYIAGQSYIEMSKTTTSVSKDGNGKDITVDNKEGNEEAVTYYTYNYPEQDDNNYTQASKNNGSYTLNSDNGTSRTYREDKRVQDYRTGEAISIKSNQLAYIPNWSVEETDDGKIYLKLPTNKVVDGKRLTDLDLFKDTWANLEEIPVIKTVVSGKTYYYFDFSEYATKDTAAMNEFIAAYSDLLNQSYDENGIPSGVSVGEALGLTNINDYEYFKIENLKVREDDSFTGADGNNPNEFMIYSNSAISVMDGTKVTVKAKSSNMKALTNAAAKINSAELAKVGVDVAYNATDKDINDLARDTAGVDDNVVITGTGATDANAITTRLQSQYKEMKYLLSNKNMEPENVTQAHDLAESEISPINHFFNFDLLKGSTTRMMDSGYGIWISDGDVEVGASIGSSNFKSGNVKGIVICKGDVTFKDEVKSFEGLIVSGSKIKINQTMNLVANGEIIKTILRECDNSQQYASSNPSKDTSFVCDLFRGYESIYQPPTTGGEIATETMKSITAIQFEDILGFANWKKNVD